MNNAVSMIADAFLFAAQRHVNQRRKGKRAEPYLNHLAEVAALVARATGGNDPALVCAAILHDTVEDTRTSSEELAARFGNDVAVLVMEVTDDKRLRKAKRKQLQIEHAASKSPRARILKLADKTSNLRALAESPPADWDRARRSEYVRWARAVCQPFAGCNEWLELEFATVVANAERRLRRAA
jgi:(p)ppGpp synthase/HD superfamily hydrolase